MDKGHYVYDVLDYNTGTWCNCYDNKITQYSGYPMNVYDCSSIDKKGKMVCMDRSDSFVSMLYIKRDILASRT